MNTRAAPAHGARTASNYGTPRLLLNFLCFQAGWLACVWGAAHDMALAGTTIGALVVALYLYGAARPRVELKLIAAAVVMGVIFDSALLATGVLQFHSGSFLSGIAPYWILALWALFATTLNVSLSWLHGRWFLAAVLGAIAGPLSYWAGAQLGAVVFVQPTAAVTAMALEWAIAMPLLMRVAQHFDGIHPPQTSAEVHHV